MAFEFAGGPRESYAWLLAVFLREATEILDERVPFPRRVALLVKWASVLHGLGYPKPSFRLEELTPRKVREIAVHMLKWVGEFIEKRRLL